MYMYINVPAIIAFFPFYPIVNASFSENKLPGHSFSSADTGRTIVPAEGLCSEGIATLAGSQS